MPEGKSVKKKEGWKCSGQQCLMCQQGTETPGPGKGQGAQSQHPLPCRWLWGCSCASHQVL